MTQTEELLLDQLKATTLAIDATVIASEHYRKLSDEMRAAIANSGTEIIEAAAAAKGLKNR